MPRKDTPENRERNREYQRKWYQANKDLQRARSKENRKKRHLWMKELKESLECSSCGEDHIATLEFHHVNPSEKEVAISFALNKGWGKQRIQKEMLKCIVL